MRSLMFSGYTSAEAGGWASAFPEIVSAVLSPTRILIFLNWTLDRRLATLSPTPQFVSSSRLARLSLLELFRARQGS